MYEISLSCYHRCFHVPRAQPKLPFFALFALFCKRQPQKSFSWILDSPFSLGSQWRALSRHLTARWLLQNITDRWMRRLWNSWSFRVKDFGRPRICSAWRKKQRCLYVRLYQSKQISLTPLWKCNKWLQTAGRDPVYYAMFVPPFSISFFFFFFACQQVVLNGAKAFSLYDIALNSAFAMDWIHYAFFWGKLCAIYHPSTTW